MQMRLLEGMDFESDETKDAARKALEEAQASAKAKEEIAPAEDKKKKKKEKLVYMSDVRCRAIFEFHA
eukprot:SAG31_NODE_3949_length_3725_cov_1.821566_2_plen_68_part_00